jgi:hypothetical protein
VCEVLEAILFWERDASQHHVPVKTEVHDVVAEHCTGFLRVPWCEERFDGREDARTIEAINIIPAGGGAGGVGKADNWQVILVLEDLGIVTELGLRNVCKCIAYLTGVATGGGGAKWETMVEIESPVEVDDKKRLVVGQDGAAPMKGFEVKCTCLCAWRSSGDLQRRGRLARHSMECV